MITNKLKKHHIHTQIESKDKSKWESSKEDKLKQMVVKDNVLYEIGDISNPLPKAFDYLDNESSSLDNNTKLMPSDSKDKA
ncbi:hypothetical protein IFR04_016233 [Cadophora malorum]|uniref:Uncharacterized protein n=1 Tax=Cadophora malorum TaxID=108018 RepID=A0A8H7SZV7_9HELO|nr:hypothetical protein IFR04_016233 [Cadophora malorum]